MIRDSVRALALGFAVSALALPLSSRAEEPAKDEDKSLTTEEYVDAGMPAPDRTWQSTDVAAAAKALQELADEDSASLPRRDSKKSGAMFKRMSSLENGSASSDKDVPLDKKVLMGAETLQGVNEMMMLYVPHLGKPGSPEAEVVDMTGALLHHAVRLIEAVKAIMPTLDPKAADNEKRMAGLKQMRDGLATMGMGCLAMFKERETYSRESLLRFCTSLKETLPTLVTEMPEMTRKEVRKKLKTLVEDEEDEGLKKAIQEVAAAVKDEPEPDK